MPFFQSVFTLIGRETNPPKPANFDSSLFSNSTQSLQKVHSKKTNISFCDISGKALFTCYKLDPLLIANVIKSFLPTAQKLNICSFECTFCRICGITTKCLSKLWWRICFSSYKSKNRLEMFVQIVVELFLVLFKELSC